MRFRLRDVCQGDVRDAGTWEGILTPSTTQQLGGWAAKTRPLSWQGSKSELESQLPQEQTGAE